MFKEITLPDGTVAESVQDIERYLKQTGSASESDYSADYYKNRRFFTEKAQEFQQTFTSALSITPKPLTVWTTTNYGKFLKRWEYQTT